MNEKDFINAGCLSTWEIYTHKLQNTGSVALHCDAAAMRYIEECERMVRILRTTLETYKKLRSE